MLMLITILIFGAVSVCYGLDVARTGIYGDATKGISIMAIAGMITVMLGNVALWYI